VWRNRQTPERLASYTILDESNLQVERGEISVEQAKEMKIIGRKKGDEFTLVKGVWKDVLCTVVDVQSKYMRAFQETLERFPTLFPTTPLLQPIRSTYEEFKEGMFRNSIKIRLYFGMLSHFYEAKKISIEPWGKFSNVPHRNVGTDLWWSLLQTRGFFRAR
jgi:hypothetical protein